MIAIIIEFEKTLLNLSYVSENVRVEELKHVRDIYVTLEFLHSYTQ